MYEFGEFVGKGCSSGLCTIVVIVLGVIIRHIEKKFISKKNKEKWYDSKKK